MKPLTAPELLTVWERGLNRPLLYKTLDLVAAACPEMNMDTVAALSIGERDARLLTLREWLFGPTLINMADCPKCNEQVEWELNVDDIRLQVPHEVDPGNPAKDYSLECGEYSIRFRLPNSFDLSTISDSAQDPDLMVEKLLELCVIDVQKSGQTFPTERLPENVLDSITEQMEKEDPQSDVSMLIDCPRCSHSWDVRFDIVSYFWAEIENWSQRMLQTVHLLASVYHWSERDILNMNPARLQMYLGMING
jgi:hypothetical protein